MSRAVAVILAVVFAHYLPSPLAQLTSDPHRAFRWLTYIFGAFESALLGWLVIGFLKQQKRTRESLAIGVACAVSIFQNLQKGACGVIAFGNEGTPLYSGLCYESLGIWPYAIAAATGIILLKVRHARLDT